MFLYNIGLVATIQGPFLMSKFLKVSNKQKISMLTFFNMMMILPWTITCVLTS